MLPSKLWYPEVLAPFRDPYSADHKPVGAPFTIAVANGPNQGVWIDLYIPKDANPGTYEAPITVTVAGKPVAFRHAGADRPWLYHPPMNSTLMATANSN